MYLKTHSKLFSETEYLCEIRIIGNLSQFLLTEFPLTTTGI